MRNQFKKLEAKDYYEFLEYYTQIEYSYFKDGNPTKNQEAITKYLTKAIEMVSPRNISPEGYLSLLNQGEIYLYYNSKLEVLGIVLATPSKSRKVLTIHEFYVLKKYQRKGIGIKMYQDFLYELKNQRYFRVRIELMCSFEGAEEFWKYIGFELKYVEKNPIGIDKKFYGKYEQPNKLG